MSEISEEQAREAIKDARRGMFYCGPTKYITAAEKVVDWAKQELSRREAERAERAKPITAEWFGGIGDEQLQMLIQRIGDTEYQFEMACESQPGVDLTVIHKDKLNLTHLPTITTRGQLLDLLKALRGGT